MAGWGTGFCARCPSACVGRARPRCCRPGSAAESVYRAGLYLVVGQVEKAERLLGSPFHEDRLLALLLLVRLYAKGDETTREEIYRLYLRNTRHINNWDLVDSSAEHVVGAHLRDRGRAPLRRPRSQRVRRSGRMRQSA